MQAINPRGIALVALTIAQAYAAAPVLEVGGNNRGDQVEFFQKLMGGHAGDPWCADFVCTCLVKAFARATGQAEDREHLPGYVHAASGALTPLSGYCPALSEGARQRFRFRSREAAPLPGDLVLFDFPDENGNKRGEPHHVGFVKEVHADGSLTTVEGNTSAGAGSQADGDGVFVRTRGRDHVFGFVHFG